MLVSRAPLVQRLRRRGKPLNAGKPRATCAPTAAAGGPVNNAGQPRGTPAATAAAGGPVNAGEPRDTP